MFFRKKDPKSAKVEGARAPAPPWENIDTVPERDKSLSPEFDLTIFTMHVTGYGKWGSRFLLLGLSLSLGFISFLLFERSEQIAPLPRDVNRPAMDSKATSTLQLKTASTTQP